MVKEHNCYIQSCAASAQSSCDTKVFISFVGKDERDRFMLSDNFRISDFTKHSITTYFESAVSVADRSKDADVVVPDVRG